jgi:hypothetical protein
MFNNNNNNNSKMKNKYQSTIKLFHKIRKKIKKKNGKMQI